MKDSLPSRQRPVLHVVSSAGVYGIERVLLNLLPELRRGGRAVTLLGLEGTGSAVCAAAAALGVDVDEVDCVGQFSVKGWASLYRAISKHDPSIVHVHGYKATILAGAICLLRGIPFVSTYHGMAMKAVDLSRGLSKYVMVETPILRHARGVIAVSDEIGGELRGRRVRPDRVAVIPNGIVGVVRQPAQKRDACAPALLSISRLAPEKNIHLVIDAVAGLRTEFPQITLIIAGAGELREELERHANALGVLGAMRFLGFVADVQGLYGQGDCFVLASQTEGMPIALLEAMSGGLPVVATRVGGIPSMVDDGCEALLVEPNSAAGLQDAIGRLLRDGRLRARLAQGARRRFERDYTAAQMARSYIAFYERIERGG